MSVVIIFAAPACSCWPPAWPGWPVCCALLLRSHVKDAQDETAPRASDGPADVALAETAGADPL